MLVYWLLGLVPVVAVGFVFWAHRKKTAQREAERQERYASLLSASREPAAGAAPGASTPAQPAAARTAPAAARTTLDLAAALAAEDAPLPYRLRPRMLAQPHAVLYYLLKAALPDHEIFVHVSVAKVIEVASQVAGAERDERRRAISQLTVDCAVCTKGMGIVVAIDLVAPGTVDATFKSRALDAAGVRYLQIDPVRLPKRGDVRTLVLGKTG